MYYFDYAYTGKGTTKIKAKSGATKVKKAASCKNRFHYITRTAHYKNHKDNLHEKVEFVKSGNMPSFAEKRPDLFWEAAHIYERKNARTAASQVIALPKELSVQQRIELAEALIKQFTDEFNFPYTAAIHNHTGEIGGQDQPHLHIMYCERSVDEHNRTAEQFFSRYNDAEPEKGGAKKITPDVRGKGKTIINEMRVDTEVIINEHLEKYAPTKIVNIKGIDVEVPNTVSCLHHEDYNKIHSTNLKAVPMIPKSLLRLDPDLTFDDEAKNTAYQEKLAERERAINEVNDLREYNNFEMYQTYYYAELERRKQAENQAQQSSQREVTADSTSLTKHLKYMNAYADDVIFWSKKQDEFWSKNDYQQAVSYMSNKYSSLHMSLDKQNLQQLEQTADLIHNDKCLLDALRRAGYERMTTTTTMTVNNALTSTERKIEHIKNPVSDKTKEIDNNLTYQNDDSPSPDF
ncbi:TPA: MobA/MobL family protein [Acinetobacter baumannii]|jgi:ketosteroid isomerase-like protein|nr:MobA/MobL family protein [Acinetobacter baumannii]